MARKPKVTETATAAPDAPIATITPAEFAVLAQVVAADDGTDDGFIHVDLATVPGLVAHNMIITNPNVTNDAGHVATKPTQHGVSYWEANKAVDTAVVPVQDAATTTSNRVTRDTAMNFDIVNDFVPPATAKPRGGNRDAYPFDKLAVGQSFFVPASDTKPEPWKSMQSTVSQAMGRYAIVSATETKVTRKGNTVPVKQRTRQFGLYEAERGGVKGAMILRQPDAIAPAAAPAPAPDAPTA